MRVRNITLLKIAFLFMLAFPSSILAQAPTVATIAPTNVTYRTTMTITGTNFVSGATVNFYASGSTGTTVAALATTFVSANQLIVVVPSVVASGSAASTRYLSVTKTVSGTTTTSAAIAYTFTPPAHTPATAVVDRIISSYGGYWSTTTTTNNTVLPDLQHSLYAFRYGGTLYSTGNNATSDATILNTLNNNAATGSYTPGDWRAIPVNNIEGAVPANASVYLVLGSMIDGSATASVPTAPSVAGLSARDVLIDGTRGLGLGTGLTNLPSTSPLTFAAGNILANKAGDDTPDILVTQVAEPTTTAFTTYCFVNAAGNIVGVPVEINMSAISKLGTYKTDFFTLTSGSTTSFNTSTVNGVGTPGGPTREIRILAYKLSDFGITESNKADVTNFKVLANGSDDMAFMAYNRETFTIPAPEITTQPVSQAACPGGTATFSIAITSTSSGTEVPVYQWEKNGVSLANGATGNGSTIAGATSATLSISGITGADYGIYRCVVSNSVGAAFSNSAYLNSVFLSTTTSASTCLNTATVLEASAVGNTPQYQWYLTANNGTSTAATGGTAISGATGTTYSPVVTAAGVKNYYVQAYPSGYACAPATSAVIPVLVYSTSVAGTISASQAICTGSTATVSLSGYTGAIQWQQSTDNAAWADITGANSATYTTAALTAVTYYRALVTNGTCGSATSGVSTISINPASVAGNISASQSVCLGNAATVSISGYTGTIQWQQSDNNSTWVVITGATSASYNTPALTATTYYRAVVTSGVCSSATSLVTTVTVNTATSVGTVSGDQTICPGTTAVSISGFTGSVQWQQSANGTTWANVTGGSGAATATYTTPAITTVTYYRAVVSSGACPVSTSATVTITPIPTFVWTGATSIYWNDGTNWACGTVPTSIQDVIIPAAPANQPTVNGITGHAKTLTVENGAHLTIATGGTLDVVNQVTVAASGLFTVENNGALVQDNATTNSGNITLYKNSNALYRLDYTMWSSPVSGTGTLYDFSPVTNSTRFYEYKYAVDPTSNQLAEQYFGVNAATTTFETAKGYLIRMPNTNAATGYNAGTGSLVYTGIFTGVPHNGNVNYTLSTVGGRYTAIGNPYPSPISVADFFAQNAGVLQANSALYFWRKKNDYTVSSYATLTLAAFTANTASPFATGVATPNYTSGGQDQAVYYSGSNTNWLISQSQGFIVRTAENLTNPQVTFANTMRRAAPATGTQGFFKSASSTASRLWLNLEGANSFSQTAVAYINGTTLDIDYGYDGAQFTDGNNVAFFSLAANTNLAIQARPDFETTDVVPMGYKATAAGSYTITLDHFDGVFADGQNIYLKDNAEGLTHNLKNSAYTFTTEEGTITDRFEVVYTTESLGTASPEITANNVIIYREGAAINISTGTTDMTGVTIYDIRGRVLYSQNGINSTQTTVSNLNAAQEVLIVEVNTLKGKVSKKIVY